MSASKIGRHGPSISRGSALHVDADGLLTPSSSALTPPSQASGPSGNLGFELAGHSGEDRVGLAPTSRLCIAVASVTAEHQAAQRNVVDGAIAIGPCRRRAPRIPSSAASDSASRRRPGVREFLPPFGARRVPRWRRLDARAETKPGLSRWAATRGRPCPLTAAWSSCESSVSACWFSSIPGVSSRLRTGLCDAMAERRGRGLRRRRSSGCDPGSTRAVRTVAVERLPRPRPGPLCAIGVRGLELSCKSR